MGFNGVIDAEGISTILTHHSENLSVVAAPVRIDSPDQASQEDVAKLLDALRRMVDFVVVDTSGMFDDLALCALDRSDAIVLVGTLDIPSLKALKLATSTLEVLNFPKSTWRFVLNRADGKVGLTVDEYEKTRRPEGRLVPGLEPRGPRGGQPGRGPRDGVPEPPELQGPRRVFSERGRQHRPSDRWHRDHTIQSEVQRLPTSPEEGMT